MLSYFEKQELETLLKKFRDKRPMFLSEKNKLRDLLKKVSPSTTSILSALGGLAVGASLASLLDDDSSSSSSSSWGSSSSSSDSDWDSGGGSFDGGGSSDDF